MCPIECRISGFGGQGVILAGVVLGLAAILDEKNAAHTQSYGPEARGGAARSDLIISNEEIDSLQVTKPNIVVAMSQEAYEKYLQKETYDYAFVDSSIVRTEFTPSSKIFPVSLTQAAIEQFGLKIVANMIMLGFINGITELVANNSLKQAVKKLVPQKTVDLNLKAITYGLSLADTNCRKGGINKVE